MTSAQEVWLGTLGVDSVGALNHACIRPSGAPSGDRPGDVAQLIRVSEGFHEKRLGRIADAIVHARRTFRVVRQNLAWAFAYNIVAIPAAAFGQVTPLVAALGMSVSSLVVVGNAMRVARMRDAASRS